VVKFQEHHSFGILNTGAYRKYVVLHKCVAGCMLVSVGLVLLSNSFSILLLFFYDHINVCIMICCSVEFYTRNFLTSIYFMNENHAL